MRICRCFTTDVCDLNGLMEIMYHQYRMINCSKRSDFVHVPDVSITPDLRNVLTSSTQNKSSEWYL